MRRLILFDIDGTLLRTNGAARRAFHRALLEVYGTAGPIATHEFDGKTDPQIAREILCAAGLTNGSVDRSLPQLWRAYLRELAGELAQPGKSAEVLAGVVDLLDALEAYRGSAMVGLLTGNIRRGADLKLAAAGLGGRFALGAYGSDDEDRSALPAVAVERARELCGRRFSGSDIVIIGDTPSDVTCGRALGVRSVAVATGRYNRTALREAGADVVLDDLSNTEASLAALLGTW
ncbi:MAG TPA: HAD hydrolase-like protein [Longimicrobiales bacterium]|nr:HAD hydrolase-like protein [Longimicrobiales bacterium]